MKKIIFKILKYFSIGTASIIFVTIGINAADHYNNFSDSIIGRMLPNKEKPLCPEDMVYVVKENSGFCIDKYEASSNENCAYSNVASQDETRANLSSADCFPSSAAGKIPWRFISQDQAVTACAKAGKRLPTSEEWYKASLGTPDKAGGWTADDCHVGNNWDSQPGPSGTGKNCVSAAGANDMVGNVWEWVQGAVTDGNYNDKVLPLSGYINSTDGASMPGTTNPIIPDSNYNNDYFWIKANGLRAIARGGYWNNETDAGQYSVYIVVPPSAVGTGVGFRCAK